MHPKRKRKLILLSLMLVGVASAVGLTLFALGNNMNVYYDPSEIVEGNVPQDKPIRAGGMVVEGSLERTPDSLDVRFAVTDYKEQIWITYNKILPDLFREGQGVIVLGKLNSEGTVEATEVLARHDENYMPPEVSSSLKTAEAASEQPQNLLTN